MRLRAWFTQQGLQVTLCDVLVEATGGGAGEQDPLDGRMFEGTEAVGVLEGLDHVGGVIALAQGEDQPRVIGGRARPCPL